MIQLVLGGVARLKGCEFAPKLRQGENLFQRRSVPVHSLSWNDYLPLPEHEHHYNLLGVLIELKILPGSETTHTVLI